MIRVASTGLAALAAAASLSVLSITEVQAQAATPTRADTAAAAESRLSVDAYLDDQAREMVRLARARRALYDSRIQAYTATAVERISVGLRAGIAERLVFRRETAARIDWTLDTVRVEVLGAREVAPVFSGAVRVPGDLDRYMPTLAFDPVDSEMMLRLDSTNLRHPLATGSEAYYRFASGDSSVITLPDGRAVRLHELRILPRRSDPQLIAGSFWVDAATHAVVQAYFRQSRAYDVARDDDDCGMACRLALAAIRPLSMELDYIAIDYGLWDLHWWLPRSIAAGGVLQAGRFAVPLQFERRYSDYTVEGDTTGRPVVQADSVRARPCRPRGAFLVTIGSTPDSAQAARNDSIRAARRAERLAAGADSAAVCDRSFIVTAADAEQLLRSDLLPPSIFTRAAGVLSAPELESLARGLRMIPAARWQLARPTVQLPADIRYNRVEGLSLSAGALADFGVLSLDAAAGMGTADQRLRAELGVMRPGMATRLRAAGYTRLAAVDPAAAPFTLAGSLNALLFGRDDHEYFRATGAELIVRPADARTQWYELRMFGERQRAAAKQTDFSVPGLFDADRQFRPNLDADAADQIGASLVLRTGRGLNPAAFRWAAQLELHAEAGDYRFTRPALRLQSSLPLGRLSLTTEVAGGSSFGRAPAQRDWLLGGAATLRGYSAGAARGEAFWLGRVELAAGRPAARMVVFSDVGSAGPLDELRSVQPLHSVGAGISLLDGLLRIDLARPLDGGRWKVHTRIDRMR
jgi:hypothetical protein